MSWITFLLDAGAKRDEKLRRRKTQLRKKKPNLEPESIDLAIMVDHEFEFPSEMLSEISKAQKISQALAAGHRRIERTYPICDAGTQSRGS